MRAPVTAQALQDRLSALMGCAPGDRPVVVTSMLRRSPREATGYWLQLMVSVGIATFGLVLGSTAVVIGAMLIAPLMQPIVGFGMGLAVGSPFLVLRSGARIAVSVGLAIGSSALITRLLPFNELNAELAARISPTALDLLVASFCAVAGVYASMRPSSDVASAAAGTSIGISLVPPLCTSGYGVGTMELSIAGGAALLFLTNFVAIVVVSTFAFAALGFNQVPVRELESLELNGGEAPRARRLASNLERLFASRSGPWLRLLMPLALLGAVYLPLRRALDEVAWQITSRAAVHSAISELGLNVVQSRVRVERGEVGVALVVLGNARDAQRARTRLQGEILRKTGAKPTLEIVAVPDSAAIAGLEAELRKPVPVLPPIDPRPDIVSGLERVESALAERWPARSMGKPLGMSVARREGALDIAVSYFGEPLDGAAREVIELSLRDDLGTPVRLVARALPSAPLIYVEGKAAEFVAELSSRLESARSLESVWLCVALPARAEQASEESAEHSLARTAVERLTAGLPRIRPIPGEGLSVRLSADRCPEPPPVLTDSAGTQPE